MTTSRQARRARVLALAAVTVVLTVTGCGTGVARDPATAASTPSLDPQAAADQDAAFATAMIMHHHQTSQLVGLAATHAQTPAVLAFAGELQNLYETQIQDLTGMLTGWGRPAPKIAGHQALGDSIPGVLDAGQLTALLASRPAEFERSFLSILLTHQQKAIGLAQKEIDLGGDPQARAVAERILQATQTQVDAIRALRAG
jgi:uncharacterized protein (DUF305 family)